MNRWIKKAVSLLCVFSLLLSLGGVVMASDNSTELDTKTVKAEKLPETGKFSGNQVGESGDISIQAVSLPYNFSFWDVTTRIYSANEFKISGSSASITCTATVADYDPYIGKPTSYNITLYKVINFGTAWQDMGTKSYPYDVRTTKTWTGLTSGNYVFMIEKNPVNDGATIEGEGTVKEP